MQHMRKISILKNVQIACYAHRHLDSALAIFVDDKFWLLNINDTELSTNDCLIIKNGINLKAHNFVHPIYKQISHEKFFSGLSVIDAIANIGTSALSKILLSK